MAAEPTTRTVKKRRRIQQKRRIDAGSTRFRSRDADVIRIGAEQTFVRADTLGEYLAPGHTPATAEPPLPNLLIQLHLSSGHGLLTCAIA